MKHTIHRVVIRNKDNTLGIQSREESVTMFFKLDTPTKQWLERIKNKKELTGGKLYYEREAY